MTTYKLLFAQENYELLYNIIRDDFNEKLHYDILNPNDNLNYLDKLIDIMKNTYNSNSKIKDLKELNKKVLRAALPYFAKHINTVNKLSNPTRDISHKIRDSEINTKGENPFINIRPEPSSKPEYLEDTNKSFDDLSIMRNNELNLKPVQPNFKLNMEEDENKNANDLFEKENIKRQNENISNNNVNNENIINNNDMNVINNDMNIVNNNDMNIVNNNDMNIINNNKRETSLDQLNKNIDNSSSILHDNKPMNVGELNIPSEFVVETNENITLDNQFNNMNNMSMEFEKKKEEYGKNDLDFSEKLNKIQFERKIEFDSNLSDNNENPYLPLEINESWESTNIYDTESKKIQERNIIEKELIDKKKIDPQELFTEDTTITKLYNEVVQQVGIRNETDVIQEVSQNKVTTETFISLNSLDRNFDVLNTNNRYAYQIKFSPTTDEWVQVPVYKNGLFKMPNAEQSRQGIRGDINLDFNEFKPQGNIIGHQYIFYKGNGGASINRIFKNVTSIKLQYLIKPLDNLCLNFNNISTCFSPKFAYNTLSYPYLLLYIKEIDGELDGTNNNLDKAFAKLVINKDYCASKVNPSNNSKNCAKDNGYLHYTVVAGGVKNFVKPINILDSITIQLLTPQGTPLNVNPDMFVVNRIFSVLDNGDTPTEIFIQNGEGENMVSFKKKDYIIEITTENKFYTKSLTSGMMVLFKNINTGDLIYDKFMNKEEGHIVLGSRLSEDINDNIIQLMSDKLYIQNYDLNCNDKMNDTYNHTYNGLDYTYTKKENVDNTIIEGYCNQPPMLINMSLQNSLIFSIDME